MLPCDIVQSSPSSAIRIHLHMHMPLASTKLFAASLCMTKAAVPLQPRASCLWLSCLQWLGVCGEDQRRTPHMQHPRGPPQHVPVPVEAPPALVTDVLSKHCLEIPQPLRCFYVPHNPNHHQWRGLNDGHGLHLLPLRDLCKDRNGKRCSVLSRIRSFPRAAW